MSRSQTRALLLAASAAAFAACDAPTDPESRSATAATFVAEHGTPVDACVAGAVEVEVSVYPKSIEVNGTSTPYTSVYDAARGDLPSSLVRWSIQDTTIVHVTGTDGDGRPILSGRKAGSTQIIGTCGSVAGSATLTVAGGSVEAKGSVAVTLNVASLAVGQTTQAIAHASDQAGQPIQNASFTWTTSNQSVATVSGGGLVTAVAEGTVSIVAAASGASGSASLAVGAAGGAPVPAPAPPPGSGSGVTATNAALPMATVTPGGMPSVSREIRVGAGGDFQRALDEAQMGDAILLAPGANYIGSFVLRDKGGADGCSGWITIRTDGSLPPIGERVTPSSAASFAKVMANSVAPAIRTDPRASCYRLTGLEISIPTSVSAYNYGLVALGDGGWTAAGEKQVTVDLAPANLVLDRLYVHGQTTTNFTRCIAMNSRSTAIVDSWISECHARGFDSQAIAGWNGPGPYLIENNFLEAAGENMMFGGADPAIPNLVPSDITIRRNHFYKNPAWRDNSWTVKNLFELKSARRLLVEGNVFENNWAAAQSGMAIVIKSANDGGSGPWQGTTDLTFRYNIVRNSPQGMNVAAQPESNPVVPVARVRIEQNFFENIGSFNGTVGGRMLIIVNALHDLTVSHNTMIHNYTESGQMALIDDSFGAARNIVFNDNVATKGGPYGAVMYSGVRIGTASLEAFAPGSWSFDRNVVIGIESDFVPWHPQSSWYAPTMADVGFANYGGGDYRLSASSPYRGKASDGSDPGVNFDALRQITNGVVVR